MNRNIYREIEKAVLGAANIAVLGHALPDGDSVGSVLGLGLALENLGKRVVRLSPDPVPETYLFLPGAEKVVLADAAEVDFDLLIVVDCTDFGRCRAEHNGMAAKCGNIINIDHHISNKSFGVINLVQPDAAATGEIIYRLINELGWQLTPEIASCLYTAVVMDTGSFTFSNTTAETHRIAGHLIDTGIDTGQINIMLFEHKPALAYRLLCKTLDTLTFSACGKVAWMKIYRTTMNALGAGDEHADGLVNYCKSISGVEVGLLFREMEDGSVKVSLRSKRTVDVNQLASIFGGGGHPRAAGCLFRGNMEEAAGKVIGAALAMVKPEE